MENSNLRITPRVNSKKHRIRVTPKVNRSMTSIERLTFSLRRHPPPPPCGAHVLTNKEFCFPAESPEREQGAAQHHERCRFRHGNNRAITDHCVKTSAVENAGQICPRGKVNGQLKDPVIGDELCSELTPKDKQVHNQIIVEVSRGSSLLEVQELQVSKQQAPASLDASIGEEQEPTI